MTACGAGAIISSLKIPAVIYQRIIIKIIPDIIASELFMLFFIYYTILILRKNRPKEVCRRNLRDSTL